jgi:hypothetical protein
MFQASPPGPVPVALHLAGIARILTNAVRLGRQPAGQVKDQTHMEGKDNEKMLIVDGARPVEHPAVGLRL